jgi:hypothetical protein
VCAEVCGDVVRVSLGEQHRRSHFSSSPFSHTVTHTILFPRVHRGQCVAGPASYIAGSGYEGHTGNDIKELIGGVDSPLPPLTLSIPRRMA